MVVPHSTGEIVRSVVRIPGSGSVFHADPTLLDLSNVSGWAATVPVPQTLPMAITRPRLSPSTRSTEPHDLAKNYQSKSHGACADVSPVQPEASVETASKSIPGRKRSRGEESRSLIFPAQKVARMSNVDAKSPNVQTSFGGGLTGTQEVKGILFSPTPGVLLSLEISHDANLAVPMVLVRQNSFVTNTSKQNKLPVTKACGAQARSPNATHFAITVPKTVLVKQQMQNQQKLFGRKFNTNAQSISSISPSQRSPAGMEVLLELSQLKQENDSLIQLITKMQNVLKDKRTLQHIARRLAEAN